ncbi:SPOR domain-containing protein [Aeromonas simiae]|uniref:SPOR domain-containing protein n=1 Tax=Aeromonas simiae TaxID=218936 RepID=UPI00266C4CE1|nr:SPOR domain-containing protein [Aeromonas simiae]MDO2947726.1 SPOR domain-containing protein [Aeromonas simiae]MDO2952346.1 SPOR domain-containing protein [Aeromonas simiae]MDO2954941.1 SPOR domain-containing protein [Aeromonas simiae]
MASQFQNRLVGTVILVALVVIFLPDLLDGNKQQEVEEESFAKIPLRPELEPAKPALQVSGASELQAAHEASQAQASAAQQPAFESAQVDEQAHQQWQVEPISGPVTVQQPESKPQPAPNHQPAAPSKPQTVTQTKPVEKKPDPKPKPVQIAEAKPKPVEPPKPKATETPKRASSGDPLGDLMSTLDKPKPAATASQGSWIIQLGAFKNVDSVNSIVAKLRAAGYPAHSVPRTPRQGELNRVVVGPDVSRDKLQGMLPRLNQLTALSGSVVAYNP